MEIFLDMENYQDIEIFQDIEIILDMEAKHHTTHSKKNGRRKQLWHMSYKI